MKLCRVWLEQTDMERAVGSPHQCPRLHIFTPDTCTFTISPHYCPRFRIFTTHTCTIAHFLHISVCSHQCPRLHIFTTHPCTIAHFHHNGAHFDHISALACTFSHFHHTCLHIHNSTTPVPYLKLHICTCPPDKCLCLHIHISTTHVGTLTFSTSILAHSHFHQTSAWISLHSCIFQCLSLYIFITCCNVAMCIRKYCIAGSCDIPYKAYTCTNTLSKHVVLELFPCGYPWVQSSGLSWFSLTQYTLLASASYHPFDSAAGPTYQPSDSMWIAG